MKFESLIIGHFVDSVWQFSVIPFPFAFVCMCVRVCMCQQYN